MTEGRAIRVKPASTEVPKEEAFDFKCTCRPRGHIWGLVGTEYAAEWRTVDWATETSWAEAAEAALSSERRLKELPSAPPPGPAEWSSDHPCPLGRLKSSNALM